MPPNHRNRFGRVSAEERAESNVLWAALHAHPSRHGSSRVTAKASEGFLEELGGSQKDLRDLRDASERESDATASPTMHVVVVDPGHGGSQSVGGSGANHAASPSGLLPQRLLEKDLTLDIARRMDALLNGRIRLLLEGAVRGRLTRSTDTNLGLAERARVAKDANAAVFLSIHFNGSTNPSIDGTEVWIAEASNAASERLARAVLGQLVPVTGVRNRGVQRKNFGVLLPTRHAPHTAACLVEVGFLSNPSQAQRLTDDRYRQRIALALTRAITDFLEPVQARTESVIEVEGESAQQATLTHWEAAEDDAEASAPAFPTLRQIWDRNRLQLVFHFVPIETSFVDAGKTYTGRFWVNADAVKWKIPASESALLTQWNRFKEPDPIDQDGDMLCRLPCTAKQCQALADVLTTHPDPLRSGAEDGLIKRKAPTHSDMRPEPCLLLTPYLYSRRYQQMRCQVNPVGRDTSKPIVGESAKHNQYLNQEIKKFMQARNNPYAVPSLGDPGKIWALHNRMYVSKADNNLPSAINYGWHGPKSSSQAVVPALKLIQSVGTRHDDAHLDYSQVCVLVSGWCEVTGPGQNEPQWMRTEAVYRSPTLCRLATHDGEPLSKTRYNV